MKDNIKFGLICYPFCLSIVDIIENVIKDLLMSRYFKNAKLMVNLNHLVMLRIILIKRGRIALHPVIMTIHHKRSVFFVIKRVKRSCKSLEDLRTIQSTTREDAVKKRAEILPNPKTSNEGC